MLFKLISSNRKQLHFLLVTVVFLLLASTCNVVLPIYLKKIVDQLTLNKQFSAAISLFAVYSALIFLQRFFSEIQFVTYAPWEQGLLKTLYQTIFQRIFKNQPDFFKKNLPGATTSRLYQAINGLDMLMFDMTFKVIPVVLEFIMISVSIAIFFDCKMSITVMMGSAFYFISMFYFNEKIIRCQTDIRDKKIVAEGKTTELLSSWKDIKLTNSYHYAESVLSASVNEILKKSIVFYKKRSLFGFLQAIPICIILLIINWRTIHDYANGIYTIGNILLVNNYLIQLLKPLESVSIVFRTLSKSYTDYIALKEILHYPKENFTVNYQLEKNKDIIFNNICLEGILRNLSIRIKYGEKVAIIGSSGSGKTSLLNAIAGLIPLCSGTIFVGEQDVSKISVVELRNRVAYLTSDARILTDTVKNNLLLGKNIDVAVALAFSGMLIKSNLLPEKENTIIQDHSLSAGESQRLKIARTYLMNAEIELYDEATANLNHALEEKILNRILFNKNKTVIFVTHKTDFLHKFDKVYQLVNGSLIEYKERFSDA